MMSAEGSETPTANSFGTTAPLIKFPGAIGAESGWRCIKGCADGAVYIPFEGYYESKGGRIESPVFELDKGSAENAWYELSFEAKSSVDGYWWVDLFDSDGSPVPDINSRLYISEGWKEYREVISVQSAAVKAQIAFVTTRGISARNVALRRITVQEAAEWCRSLYAQLPEVDLEVADDSWACLPLSRELIANGEPIHVLLLGDSIVNDTWCGNVSALVCERFPNVRMSLSVRGSTGCNYYRAPDHFAEYVLRHKPDMVLVGGISNGRDNADFSTAEEDLTAVIGLSRNAGIEVGIMSPPPSYEFRKTAEETSWDENIIIEKYDSAAGKTRRWQPLRCDYQRAAAAKTGTAYFDLTRAPCDAILRSGKPLGWFKRDIAHNDNRGKQLIAQRLAAYFYAASRKDR